MEESEEEEGEEQEGGEIDQSGLVTPAEGLATPSGFTSVPAGLETPDMIELRKKKIESEMEKYGFKLSSCTLKLNIFYLLFPAMRLHSFIPFCQRSELTE